MWLSRKHFFDLAAWRSRVRPVRPSLSAWVLALAAGAAMVGSTGLVTAPPRPEAGPIGVAFAPFTPFEDMVASVYRAGGVVVGDAHWSGVVLAIGPEGDAFADALRDEGGYLVFNETYARWLAAAR